MTFFTLTHKYNYTSTIFLNETAIISVPTLLNILYNRLVVLSFE